MKLKMLKIDKKKIVGAVCAVALFAGGCVVGAQIYANAENNAVAVLQVAKGGTGQTSLANVLGVGSALTADNATVLKTARAINGISFNGSANITLPLYGVECKYSSDRQYCRSTTAIPSGVRLVFSGTYQAGLPTSSSVTINYTGGTTFSGVTKNAGMAYKDFNLINFNVDVTTTAAIAKDAILFTMRGDEIGVKSLGDAPIYAAGATRG
jgi:hypothetical protein